MGNLSLFYLGLYFKGTFHKGLFKWTISYIEAMTMMTGTHQ